MSVVRQFLEKSLPVLIVLASLAPGAFAQQTDTLTAEKAVGFALAASPALQQAADLESAARSRLVQSRSDAYPTVGVTGAYARIGPVPAFALPGLGELPLAPVNNVDAHVTVGQTVWDFGKRGAGVDVAESGIRSAQDNLLAVRSSLTLQTVQAFYSAMLLEQSLVVQDQQIEALREHLAVTQRRVSSGSATTFDELSTSVRVAEAQGRRIDLQRMLNDQLVVLRRLIGAPWDARIVLTGGFESRDVVSPLDTLLSRSERQRADLVVAKDAMETARLQQRAAGLGDMPKLRVFATYGIKNGYEPNIDPVRGNWTVGANFDMPLFNGFLTAGKEEEAEAAFHAAEHRLEDLRRMAFAEIRQDFDGVRSAREKIGITGFQVRQSEEAVRNARIRYDSGAGTNLDVLDAETAVASSHLQQLQAFFQYALARAQLSAAAGVFSGGYAVLP